MSRTTKENDKAALCELMRFADCAVFDFDGTLADTEPLHAQTYTRLLSSHGIALGPDEFRKYIGDTERNIFSRIQDDYQTILPISELMSARKALYWDLLVKTDLRPHWLLEQFARSDNKRTKKMIVSSQNEKLILRTLARWRLDGCFDRVLSAESLSIEKKEILSSIVSRSGCAYVPGMRVVFEDNSAVLDHCYELGFFTVYIKHNLNQPRTMRHHIALTGDDMECP